MYKTGILTLSDKGAKGQRTDLSGPQISQILAATNLYQVLKTEILPDDRESIQAKLIEWADQEKLDLILTTGGTGFSPRDQTPEATIAVCDRLTPGIPEAMRYYSLAITPKAMLSRAAAGIRNRTLIINLPGSPKAVKENLEAILPALDHGLEMLLGSGSANCAEPAK
ncbi:MAG: molybdenum cofactor biosynthesis protein B [Eubacteriaceae bacterium]|jgi:molybdenum cofactor synthesis domain-containing protein